MRIREKIDKTRVKLRTRKFNRLMKKGKLIH